MNMIESLKPKFDPERLEYFREENESYASFVSPGDTTKALQLLNPTSLEIARLCTGDLTLEEIRRAYREKYPEADVEHLNRNVDQALTLLRQYGLLVSEPTLEGKLQRPELYAPKNENVSRPLDENDFKSIRQLLVGSEFPNLERLPKTFYLNPYIPQELYSDLFLRSRMFNLKESFFGIFKNGVLEFLVGFVDNRPIKPVAALSIIVGDVDWNVEKGLDLLLPLACQKMKPTQLNMAWYFMVNRLTPEKSLHPVAERLGWIQAYVLRDEFGKGMDEYLYIMKLNEDQTTDGRSGSNERSSI